jgi:hypothetical protein
MYITLADKGEPMKTYLLGSLALATAFLVGGAAGEAQAAPHGGSKSHYHGSYHYGSYKNFSYHGHYFNVRYYPRYYHGWTRYCWFPTYRCYGYYCPDDCCWYFWSPQYGCFMPVTYISTFGPVPVNVNVNFSSTVPVSPGLPPGGAPGLPPDAIPYSGTPPMP